MHLDIVLVLTINLKFIIFAACDLVDTLNYVDADLVPVCSLQRDEVGDEEEEVAHSDGDPGSEDRHVIESWHIEAKNEDATGKHTTLDNDVIWKDTVLDAQASEEPFQHGPNRVKEHVENEQLVNS